MSEYNLTMAACAVRVCESLSAQAEEDLKGSPRLVKYAEALHEAARTLGVQIWLRQHRLQRLADFRKEKDSLTPQGHEKEMARIRDSRKAKSRRKNA